MRTLREEFNKTGKMLVADIPGGKSWLSFYNILADDVVESLDYIVWQTYELGHSGLDDFSRDREEYVIFIRMYSKM